MKSVLNPDTNEVLGFDDNMSDDQIHSAIQSDRDGRPLVDVNPTPYDVMVRPALEQAKLTGNNQVLYDARRRALESDPFNKALNHGVSFGVSPDLSPEEKKVYGTENALGNLAGQTAAILSTAGLGEVIGVGKFAQEAGVAARSAVPLAARATAVGSGKILAPTAGKVIQSAVSGVTSSAALGSMYEGILESAKQGKILYDDTDGKIQQDSPDLIKIGQSILKGAVSWAPYGIGGGFISENASGLATGAAAISGTAYAVSKAEGQSEPDARLNAILMPMVHFVSHVGTMSTETRQGVVEDLKNTMADYTKAKNGMTEQSNLHQMVGDEMVKSEAQAVIDEQNAEWLAAKQEANSPARLAEEAVQARVEEQAARVAAEEKLAGTFKDPYDAKMMDYLSQFIPAKNIVRMDGAERLRLANSPRKELVAYQEIYHEAAMQEAAGDARAANKLENDILLRRTQNNTLQEVTSSDTLTKQLVGTVTKKVIAAQEPVNSARETSVEPKKENTNSAFTETKSVLQSIYDKNLPILQSASGEGKKQILQSMSRQAHEEMAQNPSTKSATATEDDLSKLFQDASEKGQIDENAVRDLFKSRSANAPSRLQQPTSGDVAVQTASQTSAPKEASSVISYVKDGKKFYTKLTPEELKGLTDEVKNIPTPPEGESQIHLDAITPNLVKAGTELSREDFVNGHSQAGEVLKVKPEIKESGLAQSVEQSAIEKGLTEDLGDLPSYQKRDMAKAAKNALDFINKDPELAKKIALGEAPEQGDVRSQELFTALRVKAIKEGDINTIRDLALSDKAAEIAAEAGQRVKAYDAGGEENPVDAIREVKKAREEIASKKAKNKDLSKEKTEVVKEIKKSIKKAAPKEEDWNDFLDQIRC